MSSTSHAAGCSPAVARPALLSHVHLRLHVRFLSIGFGNDLREQLTSWFLPGGAVSAMVEMAALGERRSVLCSCGAPGALAKVISPCFQDLR
jgi:hypothetical protein